MNPGFFLHSMVLGVSKPLFDHVGNQSLFHLTNSKTFENGVILLEYKKSLPDISKSKSQNIDTFILEES